jgi:hypothetical protein
LKHPASTGDIAATASKTAIPVPDSMGFIARSSITGQMKFGCCARAFKGKRLLGASPAL